MSASDALTVCNVFWGNRLASQPHLPHNAKLNFTAFWPDKRTFIELYRLTTDSERLLDDLVKLLLASHTIEPLQALLSEGLLKWDQKFPGNMSFAHLVCALNPVALLQLLVNYTPEANGTWTTKDNKGRDPLSVCFDSDCRKFVAKNVKGLNNKKNKNQNSPLSLTEEVKNTLLSLASAPEGLYDLAILIQMYAVNVNEVKDDEGNSLLHLAAQGGLPCLPQLFYLIQFCCGDISNVINELKMTPACLSAKLGDEKITDLLICVFGVSVHSTDLLLEWSLLHYAARYGHSELIRILLDRGADPNKEDISKCIPSFLAQRHGHNDCYRILMQHVRDRIEDLARKATEGTLVINELSPSDICAVTADGFTLLMKAVIGNRTATARELLKFECCPKDFRQMKLPDTSSLEDSTGLPTVPHHIEQSLKTAVTLAAENGFTECLHVLLNGGAHPAIADSQNWLPIHYASSGGHKESVKAIVSHPKGLTGLKLAISLAEYNGRSDIVSILNTALEKRQRDIVTPALFEIAVDGDKDFLYQLLENGDDVNPTNELSEWPLYKAASFGHIEVIKMLFEHGGIVVRHNSLNLNSPLHPAALGGHYDVLVFLLEHCSKDASSSSSEYLDINEKNGAGSSPLELAMSHGHSKVVQLLLDNGAITTLPDSTGRLLTCNAFGGIQFLLESHRKQLMDRVVKALKEQKSLKDFKLLWKNPSDFNIRDHHGDTVLMVGARYAKPDVVEFLLQSASQYNNDMKVVVSAPTPRLKGRSNHSREFNSSIEDSIHSDNPYGYMRRRESIDQLPRPQTSRKQSNRRSVRSSRQFLNSHETNGYYGGGGPVSTTEEETSSDESFNEGQYIRLNKPISSHAYASCPKGNDDMPTGHCTPSGLVCLTSTRDGMTALHRAVEGNQHKIIPLLLAADPKVANIQDRNGRSPLHLACVLNYKNCVISLFNYRGIIINTTLRDVSNKLAEELALNTRLRNRVKKYREKQLKDAHPARRPLPPEPKASPNIRQKPRKIPHASTPNSNGHTPRHTPGCTPGYTPGYTPGHTPGYTPSRYQSPIHPAVRDDPRRSRRHLDFVPEDRPPHLPHPSLGLTMEQDMRRQGPEYKSAGSVLNVGGPGSVYGDGSAYGRGPGSVFGNGPGNVYERGPGSAYGNGPGSVYEQGQGNIYERGPGSVYERGPGSVYGNGPGNVYERGPGSVYERGPGSVYERGPGSVYERGPSSVYERSPGSVYGHGPESVYGRGPGSVRGGDGYRSADPNNYRPHVPRGRHGVDDDDPGYNSVSPPNHGGSRPVLPLPFPSHGSSSVIPEVSVSPTSSMDRVAVLRDIAPYDDVPDH